MVGATVSHTHESDSGLGAKTGGDASWRACCCWSCCWSWSGGDWSWRGGETSTLVPGEGTLRGAQGVRLVRGRPVLPAEAEEGAGECAAGEGAALLQGLALPLPA